MCSYLEKNQISDFMWCHSHFLEGPLYIPEVYQKKELFFLIYAVLLD